MRGKLPLTGLDIKKCFTCQWGNCVVKTISSFADLFVEKEGILKRYLADFHLKSCIKTLDLEILNSGMNLWGTIYLTETQTVRYF